MENLNGHEAGNGGYSQGDTCRRRWSLAYSAAIANAAKTLNKTSLPWTRVAKGVAIDCASTCVGAQPIRMARRPNRPAILCNV
jgi:hypothetical protein